MENYRTRKRVIPLDIEIKFLLIVLKIASECGPCYVTAPVDVCGPSGLTSSLMSLFSLPLTITDVSLARAQVSMFRIPGIFHKLMLQPMTYLKSRRELKFVLSLKWLAML